MSNGPRLNGEFRHASEHHRLSASVLLVPIFETHAGRHTVLFARFKLHLSSQLASSAVNDTHDKVQTLPLNKTIVEVFADFLAYLFECSSSYIQETHPNGAALWKSVEGKIDFVLSHPNGWEGPQQSQMREAAILARLIPATLEGNVRLSFVTEGEASLHFSIHNGLPEGVIKVLIYFVSIEGY